MTLSEFFTMFSDPVIRLQLMRIHNNSKFYAGDIRNNRCKSLFQRYS